MTKKEKYLIYIGISHYIQHLSPQCQSLRAIAKAVIFGERMEWSASLSNIRQLSSKLAINHISTTSKSCLRTNGWRSGALFSAGLALLVFLINLSVMIWISSNFDYEDGFATIIRNDCPKVVRTNTAIHIVINALSSLLLGGSNYCMQILASPTRTEVNKAHASASWVDIGVQSYRNLYYSKGRKMKMWRLLVLSSVPLHLVFNSVFFETIGSTEYNVIVAHKEFLSGAKYNYTRFGDLESTQAALKSWDRLQAEDCINEYASAYLNTRRDLILVIEDEPAYNHTNGSVEHVHEYTLGGFRNLDYFAWICDADDGDKRYGFEYEKSRFTGNYFNSQKCNLKTDMVRSNINNWNVAGWDIDYCISEPIIGNCTLGFSRPIGITVLICNFVKCMLMLAVALIVKDRPLVTTGDAVDSFLVNPDETTKGMCLLSKKAMIAHQLGKRKWTDASPTFNNGTPILQNDELHPCHSHPLSYMSTPKRWFFPVGRSRWCPFIIMMGVCFAAMAVLLAWGIITINEITEYAVSLKELAEFGLGKINPRALIDTSEGKSWDSLAKAVLVANLPQLIFSLIYFFLNGVLTVMISTQEWTQFAYVRKPLRVSFPKPGQRSTFFLQLPYRYSIPLLLFSITLHWLISESLFLAKVSTYDRLGQVLDADVVLTCGYSPLAIIITFSIAFFVFTVTVLLGFRTYKPGIPIAGNCSLVISAACHPEKYGEVDTCAPLQWGVVDRSAASTGLTSEPGHCTITDSPVSMPEEGKLYA